MPIYEYQCAHCKKTFETTQKFSDPPLTDCELCGTGKVTRLISRTSFQLKGSGWYATDYKKSSATATTTTEKKDSGKPDGGSSEKS